MSKSKAKMSKLDAKLDKEFYKSMLNRKNIQRALSHPLVEVVTFRTYDASGKLHIITNSIA